jgi:hypothetical protein
MIYFLRQFLLYTAFITVFVAVCLWVSAFV